MSRHVPDHVAVAAAVEPVEVRLIGSDAAVRQTVAALNAAAQCGPATYRPARSGGTRAYLAIVVPVAGGER